MVSYAQAFRLSKQELSDATPPGTVKLVDHGHTDPSSTIHDAIVLVPTPSADPVDPLNWSPTRKLLALLSVSLYSFVANFCAAAVAPALPILAFVFAGRTGPESFSNLTHLIAVNVLMLGASNLWWVPLANTFGRRPVLLVATLLLTLSTMWCGLTTSFNSLLAARVVQGIGGGAADAVAPDVVGEIYFVHQRGRGMAVYTAFLAMGSMVGATSGGYIAGNHGWPSVSWVGVALSAFSFFCILLFVPETLFRRPSVDAQAADGIASSAEKKTPVTSHVELTPSDRPFTYTRSLTRFVYRGGLLRQLISPYRALLFPGVWLIMLLYGGLVGGIVTMSAVGPQLVSEPPYLWGNNAGLINVGGIIGTFLGLGWTYLVADRRLKSKAKTNANGMSEPEDRLPTMIPSLFLGTVGMWIYGFCARYPGPSRWVGLQFGFGMLTFALMQIPSIGFNYIIDSYNAISGDCFVMIVSFRAVISFAWTFFVGEWVTSRGAAEPFGIFGMLMGLFSLLVIVQWLYGKRTRIVTAKWLPAEKDH